MNTDRHQLAKKVTWFGFFANLFLMICKLLAGIFGRSSAMIADAFHSISDFATDLVVVGSLRLSARPRDKNHRYGHGKVETLAAAFVGLVLFVVAFGILGSSAWKIYGHYVQAPIQKPGFIALFAALGSILVKEILYWYTLKVGKHINSQLVIANAWHHRSDSLSSLATVFGISGAIFLGDKWVILDPLAAMGVSFFIFKVAHRIVKGSLAELIETSLPLKTEAKILEIAKNTEGVFNPHDLKTRKIGQSIAIDLHIEVHKQLNVQQAHDITVVLENALREKLGHDMFISIHIEPLP